MPKHLRTSKKKTRKGFAIDWAITRALELWWANGTEMLTVEGNLAIVIDWAKGKKKKFLGD